MEGLGQLKELQQLWLGRNRIQIVNLCGLTNLLKISLQSNHLTSMAAFQVSSIIACCLFFFLLSG
jgi:protein phosphatase 1 regulatory subunit 7